MLRKHDILATAAMTVLMAFAGQAYAGGHGGFGGGGGGGSFHPQMSGGNMGMRQGGNVQVQHNFSNMQTNHGNVMSNNIHLANNVNHNTPSNVLNSNFHQSGHGPGMSLNNFSNKGMNGQYNQSSFKQNSPWGYGTGKSNGCWGNYGSCYGNHGGCYGNYGGCYGNYGGYGNYCGYGNYGGCYGNYGYGCRSGYGYGCGYYPCGYSNWGYGCGNWGYTCGYYPRYYTCYSYPVVQPCPVVSCAYLTSTPVVTTVPACSDVALNQSAVPVTGPVNSLALSDAAIPPSPVH